MANATVRVVGLNRVVRSMKKFGVDVMDLKAVMRKIADTVTGAAKANVDSRSGRLAGSIRPLIRANNAVIRAGSKAVPYAGVPEYGGGVGHDARGPHNIKPMEFLKRAGDENRGYAVRTVQQGLSQLINKHDLN